MIQETSTSGELAQSRKTVIRTHLTALKSPHILQEADTPSKIGRRFDLKLKGGQDPDVFPLPVQGPGTSLSTPSASHHQIFCCTGFSQACSFCNPSSRRVFTVPSGFLVLAAISR